MQSADKEVHRNGELIASLLSARFPNEHVVSFKTTLDSFLESDKHAEEVSGSEDSDDIPQEM